MNSNMVIFVGPEIATGKKTPIWHLSKWNVSSPFDSSSATLISTSTRFFRNIMSQREFLVSIPVFRIIEIFLRYERILFNSWSCSAPAFRSSEREAKRSIPRIADGNRSKEAAGTPEFSDNGIMSRWGISRPNAIGTSHCSVSWIPRRKTSTSTARCA